MKKLIIIISLVIVCLFIGMCTYWRSAVQEMMMGYEMDPIEQGEWLANDFSDRLGLDGYQPDWTKHFFAEGFREHTLLIYAQPSPDFVTRLFQSIRGDSSNETNCGEWSLSPYFANDSERQVPEWWDYADKGEIECVKLELDRWLYVFGYAKEDNILYMLIENH